MINGRDRLVTCPVINPSRLAPVAELDQLGETVDPRRFGDSDRPLTCGNAPHREAREAKPAGNGRAGRFGAKSVRAVLGVRLRT